jgi:acyl-coenzyme A thioesterase PaaI-like protein
MAEQPETPPEAPAALDQPEAAGRADPAGRTQVTGPPGPSARPAAARAPAPYGTVRIVDLPEADQNSLRTALRHDTPLHDLLGLEIVEVGDDHAVLSMPVRPQAFNSTGSLHGGAIATLVDVAAGTAAARGSGFEPGHVVYARAKVLRAGRQLIVVECRVADAEDRVIAAADFSMMIVPLRKPLRPVATAKDTDPDL